jgi:hypothetical protein
LPLCSPVASRRSERRRSRPPACGPGRTHLRNTDPAGLFVTIVPIEWARAEASTKKGASFVLGKGRQEQAWHLSRQCVSYTSALKQNGRLASHVGA